MRRISRHSTRTVAAAGLAVAALTLGSCSSSDDEAATSTTESTTTGTSTEATTSETESAEKDDSDKDNEALVALENGYIKAKPADKSMTAIFGDLKNLTDEELHLVSFTTTIPDSDGEKPVYEIHSVVDGKMMEMEDGLRIEPKGQHILQPGGDHLMIMNTTVDMPVGAEFDITLNFEGGKTTTLKNVPVRYQPAGEEDYAGGHEGDSMNHGDMHEGHDHGDHGDHGDYEMKMEDNQ